MALEQVNASRVNLIGRDGILYHSSFLKSIRSWEQERASKAQATVRVFMDAEEKLILLLNSLSTGVIPPLSELSEEIVSLIQNGLKGTFQDQWDISMNYVASVESFSSMSSRLDPRGRSGLSLVEDFTKLVLLSCATFILLRMVDGISAAEQAAVISSLQNSLQQNGLSNSSTESNQANLEIESKHLFRRMNTDRLMEVLDGMHKCNPFGTVRQCCNACDFFALYFMRANNFIRPCISVLPLPGEANAHFEESEKGRRILLVANFFRLAPEIVSMAEDVRERTEKANKGKITDQCTPQDSKEIEQKLQSGEKKKGPSLNVMAKPFEPKGSSFVVNEALVVKTERLPMVLKPLSGVQEPAKSLGETGSLKPPRRRVQKTER